MTAPTGSPRMKIALYFFSLQGAGGAERMLVGLAAEMARRDHHVLVVSWDHEGARSFHPLPPTIQWHRLGASPGLRGKIRRTRRLMRLLRETRVDMFVGFVMGADKSLYVANRLLGIPIVAAERNAPDMYRMRLPAPAAWFYFQLFHLCRGVTVQFESYRRAYPRRVRSRIVVIPNPVNPASAAAMPARETERQTLLAAGRLAEQKRFDVLIDAFHDLAPRFASWDLRIAGDGDARDALEARVRRHGLEARVQFAGAVTDIEAEYARAHLFVLPSRWEGFPNALAEAMAHGLPAVGFAGATGINELIEDGVTGRLAAGVNDASSLARALSELMEDAHARRRMGDNARNAMREHRPEAVYDRWESFLRAMARR